MVSLFETKIISEVSMGKVNVVVASTVKLIDPSRFTRILQRRHASRVKVNLATIKPGGEKTIIEQNRNTARVLFPKDDLSIRTFDELMAVGLPFGLIEGGAVSLFNTDKLAIA